MLLRPLRWLLFTGALVGMLTLVVPAIRGCLDEASDGVLQTDYSRRPPARAFQDIFKQPVPPAVTDLRATGMQWIGGTNVWLRFRAPEKVTERLMRGFSSTGSAAGSELDDGVHPKLWQYEEFGRLYWDELYRAKQLDCYSRGEPAMHSESVYVDRATGTVYIFKFGI